MPRQRSRKGRRVGTVWLVALAGALLVLVAGGAYLLYVSGQQNLHQKPIILYVNQGNGVVNGSGFGTMLGYASSHGFNTVFFQVYRTGRLLFSPSTLQSFVNQTHQAGLKVFFALYITSASQALPTSIYQLHEDGMSLDMAVSVVNLTSQQAFLSQLRSGFGGVTAVTTSDLNSPLRPDWLVLETYGRDTQQYARSGMIASVGVFATSSLEDYQSQYQYALQNSDGVMVFDYYGLLKAGY